MQERVPPSVSFAFEQIVSKVCNEAKVDHDERPFMARELQNHLESYWRREIERDASTDQAQEMALAAFGSVSNVARRLRQPLWKRLLLFERYRAERAILLLSVSIAIGPMCGINELIRQNVENPGNQMAFMIVGTIMNPVLGFLATMLVQWKSHSKYMVIRILWFSRFIFSPLIFSSLFGIILLPSSTLFDLIVHKDVNRAYYLFAIGLAALIPLSFIATSCLISELFSLPQRYKRKRLARLSKI